MARQTQKQRYNDNGKPSPYAHHPKKPGIYVIYIDWKEKDRSCVHIYAEAFGAKRHLDILLQDLEYEVVDDDALIGIIDDKRWLIAENGIRVRCSRLQDILDHVDSPEEAEWKMESRNIRSIEAFRYGAAKTPRESFDQPEVELPQDTEKKVRRARTRKANAEPKTRAPREIPDGLIAVATIAESLNILPREARARLRKASVPKPAIGWLWSEAEAKEIEKLIANG